MENKYRSVKAKAYRACRGKRRAYRLCARHLAVSHMKEGAIAVAISAGYIRRRRNEKLINYRSSGKTEENRALEETVTYKVPKCLYRKTVKIDEQGESIHRLNSPA
jgi:hypothetical protein